MTRHRFERTWQLPDKYSHEHLYYMSNVSITHVCTDSSLMSVFDYDHFLLFLLLSTFF